MTASSPRFSPSARRRAWIRPPHERVLECFALPDRSHRHEMEIECSSHDGSSRCVKFGEPCALWTSSVRKRTTSRAISHSAGPDDDRASRKWATRRCLPTVCEFWLGLCPSQASVGHARWTGESERSRTHARQARNGRRVPRAILRKSRGGGVGSRPAAVAHRARGAVATVEGRDRSVQSEPRRPYPPAVPCCDTVTRGAGKTTSAP